ncbi:MAG: RsmB/NOP family class I SAM-dependent RNA methyltransferase [Alphaproteobacteria bacterium]
MKPASRIQATIDILARIAEISRVPMDSVVGDYMRTRRYIGAKDRNEIAGRVYNMARAHARITWWLDKTGAEDTARGRVLVWLAFGENGGDGVDKARLNDLFDGSKYAPEKLNEKELKRFEHMVGRDFIHPDMPLETRVECPPDYEAALKEYFGDSFEDEMTALIPAATLDLRVNIFATTREDARTSLKADGIDTEETPYSPWGLRCSDKAYLAKTKALTKGHVSIQDEGSQLIAHLCDAQPGQQVLDFCAGAGGKTLALAAAMKRKGRIVAMDTDAGRLEKGRQRYKKSGLADIIEVRCLDDEKQRKWLKRQKEKFDIVLTDVPCTGTGTWRRNPDMRWRNFGPALDELTRTQSEILTRAAALVQPGGRLVYATCSLLPAENEDQIEKFLKNHPEFELQPAPDNLGTPYMRLTPRRHNTDGFFAAVMRRKV